MDQEQLKSLLEDVRTGAVDTDDALTRLRHLPFEDLGFAKVDHHRALRHGMPEVIFAQGKAPDQVVEIASSLHERNKNLLATRVPPETAELLSKRFPDGEHFPLSRAWRVWGNRTITGKGAIAVVCAGTSDIPVAEEAR
ncbi:MAG: 1-(5-phosphoribosyl)-5-amino-4-imidazole-carboxylate carboxylase, partial [bacterium]|nr:1-(5-phosphoribosyl)-5-amino-4-imidazole-carboxylate carboxylase [bacterium]